jgi:hypothetical protein
MNVETKECLDKIIRVSVALDNFWSNCCGWAPESASVLLQEARLDRQVSFAYTLVDYFRSFPDPELEARIILGYATLRSMCESAIKLFISVYVEDYLKDTEIVLKKGKAVYPKDIKFDRLIALYVSKGEASFNSYLKRVQQRGNAIHHFKDRDTGNIEELREDIIAFNNFQMAVSNQLPYPDGIIITNYV